MTVLHDTGEGWNGFVRELIEAKERVELQHESLIRHQSGIAATLIGIIAVFWRYVTREYASSLPDSSECVISTADCSFWCVVLLFAVQTKVESTVKLLTAISRRLFGGCGAGFLTNRFMACQSLPMVVVRGNTTSIGKRSVCSTGALRASLIFSSCIFSSIS